MHSHILSDKQSNIFSYNVLLRYTEVYVLIFCRIYTGEVYIFKLFEIYRVVYSHIMPNVQGHVFQYHAVYTEVYNLISFTICHLV